MKINSYRHVHAPLSAASLILVVIVALFASGCATTIDPVTKRQVSNSYTIEEDIKIGKNILEKNVSEMRSEDIPVNQDTKMLANLQAMVKRIASVSDMPDLPYTVTLFQCDIVNAAAAPGGAIMVYEGLYDPEEEFVTNNQELAAVIAHEIAHVNCRHSTEQLTKAKNSKTAGSILSSALGVVIGVATGDASLGISAIDIADDLYAVGEHLWFPSYSRTQEYEADRISLKYLAKARIDPRAAMQIWKRAAEKSDDEGTSIFASHPKDQDRFKHMQEYLPEALELYELAGGDRKTASMVSPLDDMNHN